jgi:hypothetical protein
VARIKRKTKKPVKYTSAVGELICSLISEGQSLVKISKLENMPHVSTVFDWLARGTGERAREPYKAFADKYVHAREAQAEFYASEIIDIADDATQDELFTDEGKRACNAEFVMRSKLRVDARKWVASKLLPKKYGDKVHAVHSDPEGKPVTFSINIGDAGPDKD